MPAFLSLWAGQGELREGCLLKARSQACLLLEGGSYHLKEKDPKLLCKSLTFSASLGLKALSSSV